MWVGYVFFKWYFEKKWVGRAMGNETIYWDSHSGKCSLLLYLQLLNSSKLIVCLYVSDWYLVEVKLSLSHTQIGTF